MYSSNHVTRGSFAGKSSVVAFVDVLRISYAIFIEGFHVLCKLRSVVKVATKMSLGWFESVLVRICGLFIVRDCGMQKMVFSIRDELVANLIATWTKRGTFI